MDEQLPKRRTACKMRIGEILSAKPILVEEKLKFLEYHGKEILRVNLIANVIEKYVQEGERRFASLTLDDASGQIKVKAFGDDINKFENYIQGDTLLIVGLLKYWNNELYITPEIMKKKEPSYLLLRKLEIEAEQPKTLDKLSITALKDKIISMVKTAEQSGGVDVEKIILELKEHPEVINAEIKKLLEGGTIFEPRPGILRWLG